jgi:hypothetical protein
MTFASQLRIAIAAVLCAVVAAPAALAAGEPKNQPPFTMGDVAGRHVAATSTSDPAGEPKNEWPFIRPVARETASSAHATAESAPVASEPKNDAPFIRSVSTAPVLVESSDGFDWSDAGIGAIAALGLGCAALGAYAARGTVSRRTRATV